MTKITEEQMHPSDGMIRNIRRLSVQLETLWHAKADDTRRTNPSIGLMKRHAEAMMDYLPELIHELETLIMEGVE